MMFAAGAHTHVREKRVEKRVSMKFVAGVLHKRTETTLMADKSQGRRELLARPVYEKGIDDVLNRTKVKLAQ